MKYKINKGFTLIELLAVIIILAVIALIATPIILNVVDKARDNSNLQSVNGVLDAGRLYYTESMLDSDKKIKVDNVTDIYSDIKLQGNKPGSGKLYVNSQGLMATSIIIDKKCYIKNFDSEIEIIKDSSKCDLGFVGKDEEYPSLTFDYSNITGLNEWYKENMWVTVNASDTISGISRIKWCVSQGSKCEPSIEVFPKGDNKILTHGVNVTTESGTNYICASAIDVVGNIVSDCSKIVKLDKTAPSFIGIADKTINIGDSIDLKDGVTVSDVMSGVNGEYTVNPSIVDTTKIGTTNIEYSITDNAGNTAAITRKILVDANAPTVTFTPQGLTINSNGWSKQNFYVKVDLVDNSGLGIKEGKWCISQSDTCTPNASISGTTMSPLISTESNNNRICVQTADNNNKQSAVICSDAYKLDKTLPVAGTANISGTLGKNGWYTSNVTITENNGTDGLSGHDTTISNINSITSNTAGTNFIITTTDLAGNSATSEQTVKVDKSAPILTAKADLVTIMVKDSVNTSTYFNSPGYSISGGNFSCNPSNTSGMPVGKQTITCTATGNNGLTTNTTKTITVSNITTELFDYTGSVQTFIVPKTGNYKLEVWGARGGSNLGGKGGYSKGVVYLTAGTKLYIYVGQAGNYGDYAESFNGGGASKGTTADPRGTGGGATDIRINNDSLYARVIVAGGGGGEASTTLGGHGGGTNGISGNSWGTSIPGDSDSTAGGMYGSQIAGGIVYKSWSSAQIVRIASFGLGGSSSSGATVSGGGGGWYGGAAGNAGGGGSGWIYTADSFTNWKNGNPADSANWLLNSLHYLTDAKTIAGNGVMPTHSGDTTMTGNASNGYAKITSVGIIETPDGDSVKFSYTGSVQEFTVPITGRYKLEVWGAQGGTKNNYIGGRGGYSKGEISLTSGEKIYVNVGGKGVEPISVASSYTLGGFNGGGQSYGSATTFRGSGGGATDIRINQNSLYSRVIVAGGGGGAWGTPLYSNNMDYAVGGGIKGGNSTGHGNDESGGTQTAGGSNQANINGTFGLGGGTSSSSTYCGGGGGWYGGGASSGGSGYVYTSTTASNYPAGCLLKSSYYLTNEQMIAGNEIMPDYNGSLNMIGNNGDGYAKITLIK